MHGMTCVNMLTSDQGPMPLTDQQIKSIDLTSRNMVNSSVVNNVA